MLKFTLCRNRNIIYSYSEKYSLRISTPTSQADSSIKISSSYLLLFFLFSLLSALPRAAEFCNVIFQIYISIFYFNVHVFTPTNPLCGKNIFTLYNFVKLYACKYNLNNLSNIMSTCQVAFL